MSEEENNIDNLCTDEIKKEIDTKWKDDKMNKAWPVRALQATFYGLLAIILFILYVIVFTFKKGLDLPYILKRGEFLYYSQNEETGKEEGSFKMPKLIEQITTVIYGKPRIIGADSFVSTKEDEDENSNSNVINQQGGDKNNKENFTPNSGIHATEENVQALEEQASEKTNFVNGDKITIKGKDINDSVARLSRGWNVLVSSIGSGNINNGSIASYLIDTNHFLYNEDNYIRKFINNNFKDISSVIICINLINIIEDIGNNFEFDKELKDSVDEMQIPLVKEDIYKLFDDDDGDVIKKVFDKINLETMYNEDLLKVGVDQSLIEKKSNEAKEEINKESQESSEKGETGEDKSSEEGQTSEDKLSEEGQTSEDKSTEEGQTGEDKSTEEGRTGEDKSTEEGPQKTFEDIKREFEEKKERDKQENEDKKIADREKERIMSEAGEKAREQARKEMTEKLSLEGGKTEKEIKKEIEEAGKKAYDEARKSSESDAQKQSMEFAKEKRNKENREKKSKEAFEKAIRNGEQQRKENKKAQSLTESKGLNFFKSAEQKAREAVGREAAQQAIAEGKSFQEVEQAKKDAEQKVKDNKKAAEQQIRDERKAERDERKAEREKEKQEKRDTRNKERAIQLGEQSSISKGMNRFKSTDQKAREVAGREAAQQAVAQGKSSAEVAQIKKDAEKKTGDNQKARDLGEKTLKNKALDLTGSLFKDTKEAREAGREAAKQAREQGKSLEEVKQAQKDAQEKTKKNQDLSKALDAATKTEKGLFGQEKKPKTETERMAKDRASEIAQKAAMDGQSAKDVKKIRKQIEKQEKEKLDKEKKLQDTKEGSDAAFKNMEYNLIKQTDEDKRKSMERLADYKNKCSNDEATLKKITDLYISEKVPTDELNPMISMAKNSRIVAKDAFNSLGSTTWSGIGRLLSFSLPRVLHSINKLLNYFEFHEFSSLLILLFKNFKNQGLFKITKIKSSLKDDLINRYLFAESSINQFIEENSFKDLNDINKGIVFGYLHYEIEKSNLDQLEENDKYYLKMLSNIIINLKLKNQLIDILSRLYLNNINIKQFTINQKDLWFKTYFNHKKGQLQYLIKPSKSKKFKSYYKKDPKKYKESLLKVNALISYTESFSMMFDHMEHACFLSSQEACSTLKAGNIKEKNNSNEIVQKGGKLNKNNNRYHTNDNFNKFVENNIELFYNKKKILKNKKKILKNKRKSKTIQNTRVVLKKNKKTKKNKRNTRNKKNRTKKIKK